VPRTIALLPILPAHVRSLLSGRSVGSARQPVITVPAVVRRVLRQPEKISVSDHALKYRVVTDGAHEGQWRHEYAPHTVKIMDTFGEPWVREIWFCAVEQSGKTNTMLNCMQWAIDCAPGNVFYLMPSEDAAKKITGKKIRPMLRRSPKLAGLLSERQDDTTLSCISLRNGVDIFPAHANSATSMATWAAKYSFGDEVDKYPLMAGKETDPITLIKKRNRIYRGRYKRFFSSTAAEKFIYTEGMLKCHQVWEWRVRCPHCQELVRMDADHLALSDEATPESVELHGCDYICNACACTWSESQREQAIRTGRWVTVKGADAVRPAKVGFHHRSWECLDITLREIAVAYLKSKSGTLADKLDWAHGHEAIDYVHAQQDRKEDFILRLVDQSAPKGIVPENTSCLIILVDTQKRGFYYQVWAAGWGQDLPVAVIDHGFVERFAHLADLAAKPYHDASGDEYRITAGWIDSGGGTDQHNPKHSRTQEVYVFCKKNPLFHPLKGRRDMAQPWNLSRMEYMPSRTGKKIAIPGGLSLYLLNVTLYKGELATKLQIEPGDPGCLTLHAQVGSDYAAQLCAEYQDDRGYWQCPRGKANHHWDIGVYGCAALDIKGVRNWRQIEEPLAERSQPTQRRRRW
jgi:phage terminase large subunit GpA-like protein